MANDHELAAELAQQTGQLLLSLQTGSGLTGKELGAAGDRLAHNRIVAALAEQRPTDALLSEEGALDADRLAQSRVWVIDPLDGTREYSAGRTDWAVHICLAVDGAPVAAAVSTPALRATYATAQPLALAPGPPDPVRILVSRSRPPDIAVGVARALGAELVPMGSAGAKTVAVLRGQAHAYLHAGGQYEWDSAAPVGVALRAGLHACRIDGSPLRYNQPDPLLPDLLVCRPELADRLLAAIALQSAQ